LKVFAPTARRFSSVSNLKNEESSSVEDISEGPLIKIDEFGRAYGTGRRKTSSARVWVSDGSGQFTVNNKCITEYFQPMQREECIMPFVITKTAGLFDVKCTVKGGGISGQAGAVRLGVSRALVSYMPLLKTKLRTAGLMTRDPRRVERKKPGRKKARKQYQWVKR